MLHVVKSVAEIDAGLASNDEAKRWEAAQAAGALIDRELAAVWDLVRRHGSSSDKDTRAAVATCMLEHLLESHFDTYFSLLEQEVLDGNYLLGDTLRRCWKFGDAEEQLNSEKLDALIKKARLIFRQ